eukprot:TRINITY_DN8794_c0_g1_i1.p1 TRINITY_DN8794_c0_g1~~TRINITY_DN8794_c0_g1_i1.p1  ORF type:complete len:423 (+),score=111.19 TRINITY_DN8794_c0_g1_i1:54-1322(+)
MIIFFFFQAEDGIRDAQESRGLGDVYKRQVSTQSTGRAHPEMLGALRATALRKPALSTRILSVRTFKELPDKPSPSSAKDDEAAKVRLRRKKATRPTMVGSRAGLDVLHDPLLNKGTAWPNSERERLGLRGLVPPARLNLQTQVDKLLSAYRRIDDPLQKNLYLINLLDRNEVLFYKLVCENIEEMAPILYTPTVGQVCQSFGDVFTRARGMYFSADDAFEMASMVYNWPQDNVQVIVVTDGSRILGLGDLGACGMGIPIGKLVLYCAAGGIHPRNVLPVMLDLGTDNEELLNDPFYLGVRQKRLQGEEYFERLEECMVAIRQRWPQAMVQFEDFSSDKASTILDMFRDDSLCFNDDIQGTGATLLSGVLSSLRVKGMRLGKSTEDLADQQILVCGSGSAGLGIAGVSAGAAPGLGFGFELG